MKNGKKAIENLLREYGNEKLSDISAKTIEEDKNYVNQFMRCYGDIPMVDLVSGTWEKRKKTNLIKWMMIKSNITVDKLAEFLGCSKQYLNNKFNRDSFSIDDLVIAAYACNYTIALLENDGSNQCRVSPENFFGEESDTWERISMLKNKCKDDKRAEYEQKKAELERMKKVYGFED